MLERHGSGLPWRVDPSAANAFTFAGGGFLDDVEEGGYIEAQNAVYVSNIYITSANAANWSFYDTLVSVQGTPKLELRVGTEWISPNSVGKDSGNAVCTYPVTITAANAWRVIELPGSGITFNPNLPLSYSQQGVYP